MQCVQVSGFTPEINDNFNKLIVFLVSYQYEQFLRKPTKILLITTGTFFIGVGIIGIFIPVLPATPFLLISAALYASSSKRLYNWLILL